MPRVGLHFVQSVVGGREGFEDDRVAVVVKSRAGCGCAACVVRGGGDGASVPSSAYESSDLSASLSGDC